MSLYAIGDLHLALGMNKPMDVFGDAWTKHEEKIKDNWLKKINDLDTVLIPGDISWAMKTQEAKIDLDFIAELPGRKVFVKGNHDYWWNSTGKLNGMYENMIFLQNTFTTYEDFAICGTRGWDLPNEKFTPQDFKTYERELGRMKLSLESAVKSGYNKILFMMHFPPLLYGIEESGFTKILNEYAVDKVVYGHLHGKENFKYGKQGKIQNCNYQLVSADYINFDPVLIL